MITKGDIKQRSLLLNPRKRQTSTFNKIGIAPRLDDIELVQSERNQRIADYRVGVLMQRNK